MKTKAIIIIVLSVLVMTLTVGTVGVAFADEIRINLIGDDFSVEEKELAIANLKLKFEDKQMPTLISVEQLYDFNDEPLYGLYEFVDYYMIVIRQTSSILERGEGNSVYYGVEGKKYYGGLDKAFILTDGGYKSLISQDYTYVAKEEVEDMKDIMAELRALDYQDYLGALNTPMPLGQSNRNRLTTLGHNVYSYNYFAQRLSINYGYNYNSYIFAGNTFGVLYTYPNFAPKIYGWVAMSEFSYGWDLFYPQNIYNDCAVVAMVAVLQFYERTMNADSPLIPFTFGKGYFDYMEIYNEPLKSRSEQLRALLHDYLGTLTSNGASTFVNIDAGFNRYFEAYNINWKPMHFTSYTNIKGAVDDGNPAIMTVGAGKGWDINNRETSIDAHNLVVYGYTTNSIGVLDEFVCHALWHISDEMENVLDDGNPPVYTSELFVNKFYAAGNVYISSK